MKTGITKLKKKLFRCKCIDDQYLRVIFPDHNFETLEI